MSRTTERALSVLAALQHRPSWSGPELADHLGVTVRTVRRDVERLRELGYPIDADTGAHGGYRLGVGGAAVPPLSLDTEEAFALAVCVRAIDTGSVSGVREPAARALAKLEQLLPNPLRQQAAALSNATIRVDATSDDAGADAGVLRTVSLACQRGDELVLEYRPATGAPAERRIEPYRVVGVGRRWYLVGRDPRRVGHDSGAGRPDDGWRTLRIDRMSEVRATGHRVRFTDPPDPVRLVQHAVSTAPYRYEIDVEIAASIDEVAGRVPPSVAVLEATGPATTRLRTGGERLDVLALHVACLGLPFRVLGPPELVTQMAELADRMRAAIAPPA